MTSAELDQIHKLIGELGHYTKASEQYGHAGMAAAMRNAGAMLQRCLNELEAAEQTRGRLWEKIDG